MFSTLKTKIIFFVSLIMIVTAAVILYFTYRDVGRAMSRAEEAAARNILQLIDYNIRGEYQKLLYAKIDTMSRRRNRLKHQAEVAISVLGAYGILADERLISRREARKRSLHWIRENSAEDERLFVIDRTGRILAHPVQSLQGTSISTLTDLKGRHLIEVVRDNVLEPAGDFAVFNLNAQSEESSISSSKKLAFFLPYPQWHWTVGAIIDISDLEAEADRELQKIIGVLRMTFINIQISKSGSVVLFNGNKEMLIPPAAGTVKNYQSIRNTITGNLILQDLMDAAKAEKKITHFIASSSSENQVFEAYVSYFKTLDWYIAVVAPVDEIQAPANRLVTRQSLIIAAIFIGSLIAAFVMVVRISRPLNRLAAYAKDLPAHDFTTAEDPAENPITDLPEKSRDEVGRLAESLIFMEAELKKNIKHLMDTTAAKERIESELNVAREIQLGILPKTFPPFPEFKEFDLHATLKPAKEVGGDLYDFFFVGDDHICFTIGDVSDKGVPAALFMAITRTLIKIVAQRKLPPGEMMFQINNVLCADNPEFMFVTLIIGLLNIRTGEILYASGGHNSPIVIRRNDRSYYQEDLSGPLIGTRMDNIYKEISVALKPGDALFLYTDGVTESMNPEKEVFTDERLLEEVEKHKNESVETVIENVLTSIRSHAKSEPQSDDIAILALKYNGCSNSH